MAEKKKTKTVRASKSKAGAKQGKKKASKKRTTIAATPKADQPRKLGVDRFEAIRSIRVRGAAENNLKGIDIDIPRDVLTVMTGVSGSGKSSLAFETIFAEGQRKYMESLSAYARQFLNQLRKPDVESIDGLTPTIAIEQRAAGRNPRSTVATTTEIYDYLRLLFARVGQPTCWEVLRSDSKGQVKERCGRPIERADPSTIYQAISALPQGTKLLVLAPVVRAKKGYHRDVLEGLLRDGFVRARAAGNIVDLQEALSDPSDNPLGLGRYEMHNIEAVVDRLVVREGARQRLVDSVETALRVGKGVLMISVLDTDGSATDTTYSEHYACAVHPACSLDEMEPRLFSFNSHFGACAQCQGLGEILQFDEELCLPDPSKGVGKGGVAPWKRNGPAGMFSGKLIRRFCRDFGLRRTTPIAELEPDIRRILMHGTGPQDVEEHGKEWVGVIPHLTAWFAKTESRWAKEFLPQFMTAHHCPDCHGARLNIKALTVSLPLKSKLPADVLAAREPHGLSADPSRLGIDDFTRLNISTARETIDALILTEEQESIAGPIVREVGARLGFLASVGLEYLSLSRKTATLSGGEAQRIRLASQVGSGIVGATYVLDEPTIGLHARDNARLIRTLRHLSDIGNTVLVVEHDEEMIRAADHVIDIGPGPGVHGGTVVAQGSVETLCEEPASLTGLYLSRARTIPVPSSRRSVSEKFALTIRGARQHNLQSVDIAFPIGGLVCVTGVSGSGKSTLVNDILLRSVELHMGLKRSLPGEHDAVEGLEAIDRVIEVDQTPIGRTPRSNPATYTGMFDEIRKLFALTPDARVRGYKAGRFSFNVKGGRCEVCQGQGVRKIAMHFLPDVFVTCETCDGQRYNADTLEVKYRDHSIAQVLAMTVEEACSFFEFHRKLKRMSECLFDVGLGYLTIGQRSTTLSGGEAQRVKLATELGKGQARRGGGHTLYILDEPTTGLHFDDVSKLVHVLQALTDQGNTIVVIEHNLDVIKSADWIVDLGPDGGDGGGRVVASGPPERVAEVEESYTAHYLREILETS